MDRTIQWKCGGDPLHLIFFSSPEKYKICRSHVLMRFFCRRCSIFLSGDKKSCLIPPELGNNIYKQTGIRKAERV